MNREFIEAIDELEKEKHISKDILFEAIETALVSAYKKNYGTVDNAEVRFNEEEEGWVPTLYSQKRVVDDVYEEVKNTLNSEIAKNYFNTKVLNKLLIEHKNNKKDNYRKIWTVYCFLKWYDVFFKEGENA